MKLFILTLGCLWALTQTAYVYEKPREHLETLNENFEEFVNNYGSVANDSEDVNKVSKGKKGSTRRECSSKCFCGTPNINRIVGGTQVRQNKYPWTAQLVKGRYYPRLFCGGSLINDRYVLTAAHCVHNNRDQITIRLLQLDRSSSDPGITRKVARVIIHPQYNPTTIVNDVALLRLESPIQFNDKIRPVCLPNRNHNFDNKDAVVAGWGLIKEGGSTSNYLQEVTVPIITNQQCRNTKYKNKIYDVMLCAGLVKQGGKDACQGDSGGPLIVNEGRFKLAGVVSFGYGCAQPNAPGVYARVSKFLDWIQRNTRDSCYCSS
ncbi:trypsin-1 [Lucilia sericata]|uniref:trypsin-1 n=1 Tax=Lucilia sericata TaxID=13632 RepID=UPI0018A81AC3|nr:trypsin-1 [Lucilia sericata]